MKRETEEAIRALEEAAQRAEQLADAARDAILRDLHSVEGSIRGHFDPELGAGLYFASLRLEHASLSAHHHANTFVLCGVCNGPSWMEAFKARLKQLARGEHPEGCSREVCSKMRSELEDVVRQACATVEKGR